MRIVLDQEELMQAVAAHIKKLTGKEVHWEDLYFCIADEDGNENIGYNNVEVEVEVAINPKQ